MNPHANIYIGHSQRSFVWNTVVHTHLKHMYNRPVAVHGPLKWSVTNVKLQITLRTAQHNPFNVRNGRAATRKTFNHTHPASAVIIKYF